MRTTVDLDAPILRELKRLQKVEGKSLGRLVSDLLAAALATRKGPPRVRSPFRWIGRPMGARVDLGDKEAVHALLDRDADEPAPSGR
jgi:hypothetical protein